MAETIAPPSIVDSLPAYFARENDPAYALLCGRVVAGELEVWQAEGHSPDDTVYLFNHPREIGRNLLYSLAATSGAIDDPNQPPDLVYCPQEIRDWRAAHGFPITEPDSHYFVEG